jgi:hypothetical protein
VIACTVSLPSNSGIVMPNASLASASTQAKITPEALR